MIDTIELGYLGPSPGDAELREFRRLCPGGLKVSTNEPPGGGDLVPVKWRGNSIDFGPVELNLDGYFRVGGSLAKYRQRLFDGAAPVLTNVDVLSAASANDTVQELTERIEGALPFLPASGLNVTRLDVVYDRPVKSCIAVLNSLEGAVVPTRLGCTRFTNGQGAYTGLNLRGRAVSHRVYNKLLEMGLEAYEEVLRSEEQLRKGSNGFLRIWNADQRAFDRDACRDVLNDRYLEFGYAGALDVASLIRSDRALMAFLLLHPDYVPIYKQTVKRSAFFAMKKQIREFRASAIPEDLRVPEDAWLLAA